jgi:hypothetical protein
VAKGARASCRQNRVMTERSDNQSDNNVVEIRSNNNLKGEEFVMSESNRVFAGQEILLFGNELRLEVVIPRGTRLSVTRDPEDRRRHKLDAMLRKIMNSTKRRHLARSLARVRPSQHCPAQSMRRSRSSRRRTRIAGAAKRAIANSDGASGHQRGAIANPPTNAWGVQ